MADENQKIDLGSVGGIQTQSNPAILREGEMGVAPSSWFDQFSSQVIGNFQTGPTASLIDYKNKLLSEFENRNEPPLSVEQLKAFDPEIEWDEPLRKNTAKIISENTRRERALQEYITAGGQPGIIQDLISGIPTALDPINMGAGILTAGMLTPMTSNLIRRVGIAAGKPLGSTLRKAGESALGKFALNAVEGAVGNLAADVPNYAMREELHRDQQSLGETMAVSIGAGIGFAALGAGLKAGLRALSKEAPHVTETAIKEHVAANEANAKANQSNAEWKAKAFTDGTATDMPTYFNEVDHPSQVPFFVSTEDGLEIKSHGEHGEGIYLSDSGVAANNNGDFYRINVKSDAKFLDLNKDMSEMGSLKQRIADKLGSKIEPKTGETLKQYIDRLGVESDAGNIPDNFMDLVKEASQEAGYQGLRDVHTVNGNKRYNKLTVFDESALERGDFYKQDPSATPARSPEQIRSEHAQYIKDKTNKLYYDEKIISEIETLKAKPMWTPEEVKSFIRQNEVRTRAELRALIAEMSGKERPVTETELEAPGGAEQPGPTPPPAPTPQTPNITPSNKVKMPAKEVEIPKKLSPQEEKNLRELAVSRPEIEGLVNEVDLEFAQHDKTVQSLEAVAKCWTRSMT